MHAQSNQVLSDRTPTGLGVVVAGIAVAASVAIGAVIGVNMAAKAVPFAGGYHLATLSSAVDGTQDGLAAAKAGALSGKAADDAALAPAFVLPRNPGDIIYLPATGGAVTGPAYDDQSYLLTKPTGGSTFLDGADRRHSEALAAAAAAAQAKAISENAQIMMGRRQAAHNAAPIVAVPLETLRDQARLHGAQFGAAARRQAQAVSIEAQINAGRREAAANATPLSLFASPYFGRIPVRTLTAAELQRLSAAAAAQRANMSSTFAPAPATFSKATDSLIGDPKTDATDNVSARAGRIR